MKIAFVVTDLSNTRIGGISRVATEVGANLVELGHEVTAYVLRRSPDQKAAALNGIRLRYIEPFPTLNLDYPVVGFSYRAFGQLKRDLSQDRFDIVQSFNLNAMALCRYAKTIGNAGGRVVVSSYETIMMLSLIHI